MDSNDNIVVRIRLAQTQWQFYLYCFFQAFFVACFISFLLRLTYKEK